MWVTCTKPRCDDIGAFFSVKYLLLVEKRGEAMPNRILKEAVCTSPSIEQLSWFEEVCFYRLIVQCDDFGRIDGRERLLLSRLFPLKGEVTVEDLAAALSRLEAVGLIERYEVFDRPYLQLPTWGRHQRVRNKRSRVPPPPWELGIENWEDE